MAKIRVVTLLHQSDDMFLSGTAETEFDCLVNRFVQVYCGGHLLSDSSVINY